MPLESVAENITWYTNALDYIARSTPFFLVTCTLLAYYYREKIKSVLARSVSKEIEELKSKYAIELSQQQARLQRELEAYKVSLIAETERIKAAQDLKKSIALKFSEKRFVAIASILDAHAGLDTDLTALLGIECENVFEVEIYNKHMAAISERLSAYSKAYSSALLFIDTDLRNNILAFRTACNKIMALRSNASQPALEGEHEEVKNLFKQSLQLEELLKKSIRDYESI